MSASFSYSRRHAVALDRLKQKLEEEGLPVLMFGINAHHRASQLMASQLSQLVNFTVYQSSHDHQLWSKIGGMKDDVFIYDDCGRLTYFLPFPHSFVASRFVELAIRSTSSHMICGPRNETQTVVNVKLLRENQNAASSRRRTVEHRKCTCLPGSGAAAREQHCLCRARSGAYTMEGQDSCFCKWMKEDMESKCRCHKSFDSSTDSRYCDCRVGLGEHALTEQACYCQTSPQPYGRFAPESGPRQNAFCTRHAQPLM